MRYGLLGEDTSGDLDKLQKYTGEVGWSYLEKHFRSGALLYVDPALDLVAVGKALAEDDHAAVLAWKKAGDLVQPSAPHAAYWEESGAKFLALVVSPFVLIQPA
jgi:hypothetical protein